MGGAIDTIFPVGTYWMRRFARVVCETGEAIQQRSGTPAALPTGTA